MRMMSLCHSSFSLRHLFEWILNILAPGCADRHHHILHPDSKHGHLSVLHACSAFSCTPLLTHNCAVTAALTSSLTSAKQWSWLINGYRKRQRKGTVLITTNRTTCRESLASGSSGFTSARTWPELTTLTPTKRQWDNSSSSSACWRGLIWTQEYSETSSGETIKYPEWLHQCLYCPQLWWSNKVKLII